MSFCKRIIWYFTPAKSTVVDKVTPEMGVIEERPSLYISTVGHVVLGVIYSVFMFGYIGLLIYNWTQRETFSTFSQEPSTDYDPIPMHIEAYCTNPPYCGDITVTVDYAQVPGCSMLRSNSTVIPASSTAKGSSQTSYGFDLPLCFTNDPVFTTQSEPLGIPGVTVEFEAISTASTGPTPQGVVIVSDYPTGAQSNKTRLGRRQIRLINMDPVQVKSLIVGQSITYIHGEMTSLEAYPMGIQYDGKHPSTRATFILAEAAFTDVTKIWRSHWLTIIGVFGSCAMAAWVVFTFMLIIIPLWPLMFPGPAQKLLKKN